MRVVAASRTVEPSSVKVVPGPIIVVGSSTSTVIIVVNVDRRIKGGRRREGNEDEVQDISVMAFYTKVLNIVERDTSGQFMKVFRLVG